MSLKTQIEVTIHRHGWHLLKPSPSEDESESLETTKVLIREVKLGALWSSGRLWGKGERSFPTRGRAPVSLTLLVTQGTAA